MKSSFLILLTIVCFGCAGLERPEHLEDVNALLDQLGVIHQEMEMIQPEELKQMSESFDSLVFIVEEIQPDSISLDLALKLDKYRSMAKGANEVNSQYEELIDLMDKRQSVVSQLKEDIELSRGQRDKYAEYIQFETEQLNKLKGRVDSCMLQVENSLLIYNELNASIVQDVMVLRKDTLPN